MGQFLRGENLHLRPLENETDVRTLYEIWNDPESVGEHLEFTAWSWDSFSKYIGGLDKSPDEQTFLLVVKNEGEDTVGFVNFRYPRPWRYTVEIGYQFRPSARGKGYAVEGTRLLVNYLFSNRPIERIEAVTGSENAPSRKLLERVGFTQEGRTRRSYFVRGTYSDSLIYGLLREEWAP